jgi:hypothetical protein
MEFCPAFAGHAFAWILNFEFLIEEGIAHAKVAKGGKNKRVRRWECVKVV